MNRIPKFSGLLALLFVIGGTASLPAQNQPGRSAEEMAAADTQWMTEVLNLDQTQVPKVQAINLEYAKKLVALHQSGKEEAAAKTQWKELDKAKDEDLKKVLTDEQLQTYLVKKKEKKDKMKDSSGSR